jgi:hypothetical protein
VTKLSAVPTYSAYTQMARALEAELMDDHGTADRMTRSTTSSRAWRWQRLLDDGVYASVSDIGDAENISKSYVSGILRLAMLARDIVRRNPRGKDGSGSDSGATGAAAANSLVPFVSGS